MAGSFFLDVCRFNPTAGGTTDWTYSSAVTGYQSPAAANVVSGAQYSYRAESANLSQWEIGVGTYSAGVLSRTTVLFNSSGTTAKINFSAAPQVAIVALAEDLLADAVTFRQNALLDRIYLAKMLGAPRRVLRAFADGYKASDGINAGSSSNYTVDTTAMNLAPNTSDTRLSGGTPSAPLGGTAANINDNNTATSITYTGTNLTAAGINSRILAKIDYGSNQAISKIEAVGVSQSTGSNSGTGLYYSTDNTNWTQLGASLPATSTTPTTTARTGSVTARYVAVILPATDFTGANVTLQDLNGYTPTVNNMTVVTTASTADASVSNGQALLEIDNSASPTLNTDLTVEITCNGGTNWTAATLSLVGTGQSGRKVLETPDVACTAGTSFAARIKTFNSKSIPIYGLSLTVH